MHLVCTIWCWSLDLSQALWQSSLQFLGHLCIFQQLLWWFMTYIYSIHCGTLTTNLRYILARVISPTQIMAEMQLLLGQNMATVIVCCSNRIQVFRTRNEYHHLSRYSYGPSRVESRYLTTPLRGTALQQAWKSRYKLSGSGSEAAPPCGMPWAGDSRVSTLLSQLAPHIGEPAAPRVRQPDKPAGQGALGTIAPELQTLEDLAAVEWTWHDSCHLHCCPPLKSSSEMFHSFS